MVGLLVRAAVARSRDFDGAYESRLKNGSKARAGAKLAPAVFGPKANAEAKADHLAHDRWVIALEGDCGAKPQFGALRQAEVANVARACEP